MLVCNFKLHTTLFMNEKMTDIVRKHKLRRSLYQVNVLNLKLEKDLSSCTYLCNTCYFMLKTSNLPELNF